VVNRDRASFFDQAGEEARTRGRKRGKPPVLTLSSCYSPSNLGGVARPAAPPIGGGQLWRPTGGKGGGRRGGAEPGPGRPADGSPLLPPAVVASAVREMDDRVVFTVGGAAGWEAQAPMPAGRPGERGKGERQAEKWRGAPAETAHTRFLPAPLSFPSRRQVVVHARVRTQRGRAHAQAFTPAVESRAVWGRGRAPRPPREEERRAGARCSRRGPPPFGSRGRARTRGPPPTSPAPPRGVVQTS